MESIKRHARRLSGSFFHSPTKETPTFFDGEEKVQPIKIQLGPVSLEYQNAVWNSESKVEDDLRQQVAIKTQLNKDLEIENQLLKFKVGVLIEMVATTKLDNLTFQQRLDELSRAD